MRYFVGKDSLLHYKKRGSEMQEIPQIWTDLGDFCQSPKINQIRVPSITACDIEP
jgi:hypothetical protein